ncbi:MAG: hypothetical protein SFU98_13165 [Leptospiraceae bacterium]|nr:hypothetical protein [Leptospiraceae bacterium]
MIYKISDQNGQLYLKSATAYSIDKEAKLEELLKSPDEDGFLNENIFGEQLLFLGTQIRTKDKKRSDILAIDSYGNTVVIELKKDKAKLGVETQALQYLADLSAFRGKGFIERFKDQLSSFGTTPEETLKGFLGDDYDLEQLNAKQSIILVAQSFDPSLFSMGQWLSEQGVPFKCISYDYYSINSEEFISFSIEFDQLSNKKKKLYFNSPVTKRRDPEIYWFNIGFENQQAWDTMKNYKFISAGFDGIEGDRGDQILNSLNDAIKPKELKDIVGISNPIQTKQLFPKNKIQELISRF